MNKSEIIREISRTRGVSQTRTEIILREMLGTIERTLSEGEDVELRRFGSFRIRERKKTQARHPGTGRPFSIPARILPVFRPSRALMEQVDRSGMEGT
jgi:integration host factor subunit beta